MLVIGNKNLENGYTLIELLVVLAILAAVFATLPALLPSLNRSSSLQQSAILVEQDLKKSRLKAMTSGQVKVIILSQGSVLYSGRFEGNELEVASYASPEMEPLEALYFYPNGRSSGASIEIKDERNTILINVDPLTGRIRKAP